MRNAACLFALLSVLAAIRLGDCNPKCYICDTLRNPNCVHPESHKMDTHECTPNNLLDMKTTVDTLGLASLATYFDVEIDRSDFNVPFSCIKTVSKVHDKEVILRGCQLAPKDNLDVCKKLLQEGKDVVQYCSLCNENACNSAPFKAVSVGLVTLLIPALAAL